MAKLEQISSANRLFETIRYYQDQSIAHQVNQPKLSVQQDKAAELKLQFYKELVKTFNKQLTPNEKKTRAYIRNEIRRLQLLTKPGILNFILYNRASRALFSWVNGNIAAIEINKTNLKQAKQSATVQHSAVLLNKQLQEAGFTQNIDAHLKKMMEQGIANFHYRYYDIKHPHTDFVLHFAKAPGSDIYQIEKFEAGAIPGTGVSPNYKPDYFTFSRNAGIEFSATEASNLLQGGGVAIENEVNKWIVLDRTNKLHPFCVVPFDLDKALQNITLPELNVVELNNLKDALQKGESKELTYKVQGDDMIVKLKASPTDLTVYLTDSKNRVINLAILKDNQQPLSEQVLMQQIQKQVQGAKEYVPRLSRV